MMSALSSFVAALSASRKAATAVEYGLILALVVMAAMIGIIGLGGASSETWGNIHAKVKAANGN